MKKQRPESAFLQDIYDAAELSIGFIKGIARDAFEKDLKTQSAILHQLAIIGEATKNVSKEFRSAHPEIVWKKMAGMRDILVHAYYELDFDAIWETVTESLPELLSQLKPLISTPSS